MQVQKIIKFFQDEKRGIAQYSRIYMGNITDSSQNALELMSKLVLLKSTPRPSGWHVA